MTPEITEMTLKYTKITFKINYNGDILYHMFKSSGKCFKTKQN